MVAPARRLVRPGPRGRPGRPILPAVADAEGHRAPGADRRCDRLARLRPRRRDLRSAQPHRLALRRPRRVRRCGRRRLRRVTSGARGRGRGSLAAGGAHRRQRAGGGGDRRLLRHRRAPRPRAPPPSRRCRADGRRHGHQPAGRGAGREGPAHRPHRVRPAATEAPARGHPERGRRCPARHPGRGFRRSAGAIGRTLERRLGLPPAPSRWAGRALAAGVWYGTGKALADTAVRGLRLYDRVVDTGFDRAPTSPLRSSGDGSPIAFARLGREGRRFVLNVPTVDDIERVMERPAVAEPIRVFVGYAAARTDDERVALAVEELRRTGAFDRRLLVVGCPAGNGYVNTLPLEVLDHVLGGDTAAVAVQYGRLPSFLTLQRVPRGGRVQRALLEAIRDELAGRPPEQRPTVVCYGESLGAWSGQDTFMGTGVDGLDELGVARALWAGTPYYSGWRREVLVDRTVPVPTGSVVQVDRPAALLERSADELARLRAVILDHGNDPVCYLSAGLLVRTPPWLLAAGDRRPWGVPADMTWLPFVTAVQVIVDAVNATRPVPGVFRATGHEYTADLPDVTLAAYGVERPDDETWTRLVGHLQAVDAERAARHKLPRDDGAGVPAGRGAGRAS
ncbi:MAG: alpha/beta-hydrolase family protein [Acidimicrobiales bacterium]